MNKKRLFQILARADREEVIQLGNKLKQECHSVTVVKKPEKTLTMIKMREPVKNSLFYLGEIIVTEATVTLDGSTGVAVTMGDDFDKTLSMAMIDAACNAGVFHYEELLLAWESEQHLQMEKENAMMQKTKVDFHSMDSEVAT